MIQCKKMLSMGNIETTNEDVSITDNGLDGVDDSMDI